MYAFLDLSQGNLSLGQDGQVDVDHSWKISNLSDGHTVVVTTFSVLFNIFDFNIKFYH